MSDAALASSGAKLVMATCYDERFPPENIIDGDENTFWMTTGLFPQEVVVELPQVTEVTRITTVSVHAKKIVIEKCDSARPVSFEKALEADLTNMGARSQTETHQVNFKAKFIKVIFEAGYEPFAAVSKVSVITHDSVGKGSGALRGRGGYDEDEEEEDAF